MLSSKNLGEELLQIDSAVATFLPEKSTLPRPEVDLSGSSSSSASSSASSSVGSVADLGLVAESTNSFQQFQQFRIMLTCGPRE